MITESLFSIGVGYGDTMLSIQEDLLFDTDISLPELHRYRNDVELEHDLQQMYSNLSAESSIAGSDYSILDDVTGPTALADNLVSLCETLGSPLVSSVAQPHLLDQDICDLRWDSTDGKTLADKSSNITSELSVDDVTSSDNNCDDVGTEHVQHSDISWSSTNERTLGEELLDVICTRLDLRQQLEVLHLIDPRARHGDLAHMDLDDVSEDTLELVRRYVTEQQQHHSDVTKGCDVEHSRDAGERSSGCDSHTCHSTRAHRRQTKKQRREKQRLERQRRQKEARQIEKERRSGLFRSEQVLSLRRLSESRDVSEEEVDIFT